MQAGQFAENEQVIDFLPVLGHFPYDPVVIDADYYGENLFDKHASRFMEFECLVFLEGCLVRAMIMTAKTGDTAGWV